MSSNVISFGVMALLAYPVTKINRDALQDTFYADGSILKINYEGTIVYSDHRTFNDEGYGLKIMNNNNVQQFHNELVKYGINTIAQYSRPYHCMWYNGSDSDMDMLTAEQFKDLVDAQ